MLKMKNATFVKSILNWQERPLPDLPEIAFVGRSNVGKSSLINCLLNRNNFARVSKQPGKTQTINYFSIDELFYLVDLPGYGYAKTSKKLKNEWQKAIELYLLNSPYLRMLMVLIDGKVGPKQNDLQLLEWLDYHQIPFQIVVTKMDKMSKNAGMQQLKKIRQQLDLDKLADLLPSSAKNKSGREQIISFIDNLLD